MAAAPLALVGHLDLRRQAAIASGSIIDHKDDCVIQRDPNFNLDATIFQTLEGAIPRFMMKKDLGVKPFWNDAAIARISEAYRKIERPLPIDKDLYEFMHNECNFVMEHADGSFMDHLTFCRDYCQVHYKEHSPRVLFLHSILGVGTNYFPMEKSKIPKLQAMLTAEEMKHVEAFPSILRLLLSWRLVEELNAKAASLDKLKSIKFHRVIDNQALEMNVEDLWVQLNYQMIHFLDFAPTADWEHGVSQTVFQGCLRLYEFLNKAGQLRAKVIINPVSLSGVMPTLKKVVGARVLAGYSAKIGHSLNYELVWEGGSKL